jgi:hypothetical protein
MDIILTELYDVIQESVEKETGKTVFNLRSCWLHHRDTLNEHAFDLIVVHCSCYHQRAKRNNFVSYPFPLINSKTCGAITNGNFLFTTCKVFAMCESGNIN